MLEMYDPNIESPSAHPGRFRSAAVNASVFRVLRDRKTPSPTTPTRYAPSTARSNRASPKVIAGNVTGSPARSNIPQALVYYSRDASFVWLRPTERAARLRWALFARSRFTRPARQTQRASTLKKTLPLRPPQPH